MSQIPIYQAEREAGLAELIRSTASISYASEIESIDPFQITEKAQAKINKFGHTQGSEEQIDLHYLKTILVSVGRNKNDDVFDPLETYLARNTPEDKPFNYEHNQGDIIGHITGSYVIDEDGNTIDEDTDADDLPAKFHIVTNAVLYKFWPKSEELQERMDTLLEEIAEGKWFVSMECLFRGFDYLLTSASGESRIVARNKKTAFLTKHLRAYGGKGKYGEFSVGRVLRNIVFSGKGLVRKPANPESIIILGETEKIIPENSESSISFLEDVGYSNSAEDNLQENKQESSPTMADTNINTDLVAAQARIAELEKQIRDSDISKANEAKAEVEKQLEEANKTIASLNEEVKTKTEEITKLAAQAKTVEEARVALATELDGIKAEARKVERLGKVKAALKVDETDEASVAAARELAESLADLSDESFEKHVAAVAKFTPAPLPPKNTPAPLPPKGTPAATASTEDEETADASTLESAEVVEEPSLNQDVEDNGVNELHASIASYFGCEEEAESEEE